MERCIVLQCKSKSENKGVVPHVVLHEFPATISKIKLWLQQTHQHFDDIDSFALRIQHAKSKRTFLMCSAHFSEDSYILRGNERVLKEDALPTIFPESNGALLIKEIGTSETAQLLQKHSSKASSDTSTSTAVLRRDVCTQTEPACFYVDDSTQCVSWDSRGNTDLPKTKTDHHHDQERTSITFAPKSNFESSEMEKSQTMMKPHVQIPLCSAAQASLEEAAITGKVQEVATKNISAKASADDVPDDLNLSAEMSEIQCSEVAVKKEMDYVNERKFLVFESCLDSLFLKAFCGAGLGCVNPVEKVIKKVEGSLLSVTGFCDQGHSFLLWESQPRLKSVAVGNILSAAAILCSGSNFKKIHEMNSILGVQQISHGTYRSYRRRYLYAAIDHHWQIEQMQLKEERLGKPLHVACDGQHNSRGNVAKYCVNMMMDVRTKEILDFETVLSTQQSSPAEMEKKAFEICLDRMLEENYNLHVVATDRHEGIRALMREKYSTILHQYDIWHYAQSLKKKLLILSKKKLCSDIGLWIDALVYHFQWSIQTSGRNEKLLFEKWASLLNHVTDQHSWKNAVFYHECMHKELTTNEREAVAWLKRNSTAYEHLYSFVTDEQLKEDLVHLVPYCDTLAMEVSRCLMLKYKPKGIRFKTDSVEARIQLAILAHNFNMRHNRAIVKDSRKSSEAQGTKKAIFDDRKSQKRWVVQHKHLPVSVAHLEEILNDVLRKCGGSLHINWRRKTTSDNLDFGLLPKSECAMGEEEPTPGLQ